MQSPHRATRVLVVLALLFMAGAVLHILNGGH